MQRIVVLVGLPGSGKSSWLERQGIVPLSSDAMRVLLADDVTDQTIHGRVFAALRYLLRQRLAIGREVSYVDATHLTPAERAPYIRMGRAFGCRMEAVYFDVPVDICVARNAGRTRVVPEEAIRMLAAKLIPPTEAEGFDQVTVIGPEMVRQNETEG